MRTDKLIDKILDNFRSSFPYKIANVIDDFGSPVKDEIEGFIHQALLDLVQQVREETIKAVLPDIMTYSTSTNRATPKITNSDSREGYEYCRQKVIDNTKELYGINMEDKDEYHK